MGRGRALLSAIALLGLIGLLVLVQPVPGPGGSSGPSAAHSAMGGSSPTINPVDGLPTIMANALPPEARATLALIDSGGPYPFRQDGTTYQNRERLLPARAPDHYREFTVATPASADRGPQRIVIGTDGERYWTSDHYASFARIVP